MPTSVPLKNGERVVDRIMSSTTTNCVQLALHDKRLSTAMLAATNRCQYLKNAELLNQKYNILDICICVTDVVKDPEMPLDMSGKVVRGLAEIYHFNLKTLGRSLQLNKNSKISFKRKEIEIEVHVKNKRLKENINSWNLDNLYCLDFENDVLTDEQIIQCLLSNKNQTSVRNIADITIREAPPSIAYNTLDDQDDDFGPVTATEMEQFYFPPFDTNVHREPLHAEQCEQDLDNVRFEALDLGNCYQDLNRNSMDCETIHPANDVSIQPLDDVPMEMVPEESAELPFLTDHNYQMKENVECTATPAINETPSLAQSMITDSIHIAKTCAKKLDAKRQTKLSAKHMEHSFENYRKLQRKRPSEELRLVIAAKKAENLHNKPLRRSLFSICFERYPKVHRSQHKVNRKLLLEKLGVKSVNGSTKNSGPPTDDVTAATTVVSEPVAVSGMAQGPNVDTAATAVTAAIPEPIASSANDAPENRLIGETGKEPPPGNECYVSDNEMLSLLQRLWECIPESLPFDLVKSHIKNRFTAASVFAHLLAFSAKGIIRVTKDDNGSPQTLIKGPNWM